MKSAKILAFIILMATSYVSIAQKLTTPQVQGIESGSKISMSFPFTIIGIPFSQIPGSVWSKHYNSHVFLELFMSYYMEGDPKQYSHTRKFSVNIGETGNWSFRNIQPYPKPYHIPGKKMVEGSAFYSIFIYQQNEKRERSSSWNAEIKKSTIKTADVTDKKLEPKTAPPIEKIILNPQPIPPKTDKKLIRKKD